MTLIIEMASGILSDEQGVAYEVVRHTADTTPTPAHRVETAETALALVPVEAPMSQQALPLDLAVEDASRFLDKMD